MSSKEQETEYLLSNASDKHIASKAPAEPLAYPIEFIVPKKYRVPIIIGTFLFIIITYITMHNVEFLEVIRYL